MTDQTMSEYEQRLVLNGRQRDEYRLSMSSTRWEKVSAGLRSRPKVETVAPKAPPGRRKKTRQA